MITLTAGHEVSLQDRPHWVYRCFDADGHLLYVGMTNNPVERMKGHRSQSHWFAEMASYSLVGPFHGDGARRRARAAEARLISSESPRHNAPRAPRRRPVVITEPSYEELPTVLLNWHFIADYLRHTGRCSSDLAEGLALRGLNLDPMRRNRVPRHLAEGIADVLGCGVPSLAPELAGFVLAANA